MKGRSCPPVAMQGAVHLQSRPIASRARTCISSSLGPSREDLVRIFCKAPSKVTQGQTAFRKTLLAGAFPQGR